MRIIANNLGDTSTLAASPAMVSTLPVSNLQTQEREKVARTTSTATQTIDVTLASARPISACVLYRGNFTSLSTWSVKVYDAPAMGTLLYDSGSQYLAAPKPLGDLVFGVDPLGINLFSDWGYTFSALWFPQVVGGFVRITLDDPSNPDGYLEASRLFVGAYWEPSGMPYNVSLAWKENTQLARTDGGTLRSEAGAGYRALNIDGQMMPEQDRIQITTLLRVAGMRLDVYVSAFPGLGNAMERDYQMQAKLVSLEGTTMSLYGYVNQQFNFEEV